MTAEKKIAQKRLTLLQVAERIRNVSEACRRHSVSRSQFYEYKRAFQERVDSSFVNASCEIPTCKHGCKEIPH